MYSCTLFQNPNPLTHTSPRQQPRRIPHQPMSTFLVKTNFFFFSTRISLWGLLSRSLSMRVLTTLCTNGKGSTRAYIYARIISDDGGGEGCSSGYVWRRGAEDFVEEKRREEDCSMRGGADGGGHALVYTCDRVGGEVVRYNNHAIVLPFCRKFSVLDAYNNIVIYHFKKSCSAPMVNS